MTRILIVNSLLILAILFFGCEKNNSTEPEFKTMTGNDGKTYQTIKIGNQWWMAENLRETKYRNGEGLPNVIGNSAWIGYSNGAYCAYNNNESTANTYGYLYNWYALNDDRNIAPPGWRVPTDDDWKELEMALGMSQEAANSMYFRGSPVGSKLAGNADLWENGKLVNNSAFGESGFSALPAGIRRGFHGLFDSLGSFAFFWSASEPSFGRRLGYNYSAVGRYFHDKHDGLSVRLVKDD